MLAQMAQGTPSDYTSALRWLPCSRIVAIHDRGGSLAMDPTHSSSCTWESLVHVSQVLGLQDLHGRATKALGYHCQMLVVRTIMPSVVAEVAHNGFDEMQLDLQLALNEDLLGAFLELYGSEGDGNEAQEGVRVGREMVVPVEREGGTDKREDDVQGSRETMTTTSTTTPGLLDDAECQDRILELCKDIRSLFLDLQDIMAT